ncbi:unnamed protein product [Rotaria magnacalcarata]|uniref:G-protein coupled receptors family 1 profile domain-containing protein n=1 Tax=Rotaria magnacalcarata TaxID=392030 RepID=A0A815YWK8_9BILA|nr:unnamed protein product [Rotaria magnacalcarata]CAF1659903.1 unnamed protein product [Rotaria magnacalcarata]CAF2126181.1 unnamed protein product [Rotaria magnacalcarata]CAF4005907.1 unnamed protein product [Rotaria magnacalcarata]CAF4078525.1 unnamed protein product [Rotaria magnacalcarata]
MSTNDDYYIEILNNISIYLYRYGNLAIYILGNIGNLLSILIFSRKPWKKNVCVFYFITFLILSCIYLNSIILGTALINGFDINVQNSNALLCKLFHYVGIFSSTLLPTVIILASIDRLLISSQNVDTRLYSSKRLAYFSISLSALFWLFFHIHLLIKVNIQQIGSSDWICDFDLSGSYIYFVNYSLMTFNCLFCLLMIILSILAFKNVRYIRCTPRHQRKQIRSMTKKDFQLIRCLFVLVIVYISVSIAPTLNSVYTTATKNQIRTPLQDETVYFIANLFVFIYFTFYCSNFFIFLIVSKAFRYELKRIFFKLFDNDLAVLTEEENIQKNNEHLNVTVVNTIEIPFCCENK